ncbi:hypothetical protein C1H46_026007 [Malus baccata]|uniref:Uncharacterized protein n=1 Tax=Malus baccata TaxID=106549 RepID=A0A540LPJ3_MALBA|nr:hypothetical protein C1H46_026007 [Malus baccata]
MPRFVRVSTRIFETSQFSDVFVTIPAKIGVEVGLKLFLITSERKRLGYEQ